MTVADLKKLCDECRNPEGTVVMIPSSDHHYRHHLQCELSKAVYDKRYGYSEFWEDVPLERGEKTVDALIIT